MKLLAVQVFPKRGAYEPNYTASQAVRVMFMVTTVRNSNITQKAPTSD